MEELKKLSRDQMQQIMGGEPPICNEGAACFNERGLAGFCTLVDVVACMCYREDDGYFNPRWYCSGVS